MAAIVVAAGAGERFGARKQFLDLAGGTVASRSVAAARSVADVVILVAPADALADLHGADVVVAGGATRSASVRAGLAAIDADVDVVVVHDAARPLASEGLFHAVVDAVGGAVAGAVPGVAVTDTVKLLADAPGGVVESTPDRRRLVAVQTPQAFVAAALRRAHATGADASDDAALLEAIGERVVVVQGDERNVKITTARDLNDVRAAVEPS